MLPCATVMTKDPVACAPTDTVSVAALLMKTKDISGVPVIENRQTGRVVGIVTIRDLLVRVLARGRDPASTEIGEIMTSDPVVCHPDAPVAQVIAALIFHQIRRVPIVNEHGRLIGIVTLSDLALHLEVPAVVRGILSKAARAGKHRTTEPAEPPHRQEPL